MREFYGGDVCGIGVLVEYHVKPLCEIISIRELALPPFFEELSPLVCIVHS